MACCIVGCPTSRKRSKGVSFYAVQRPGDRDWQEQLVQCINRCDPSFNISNAIICSLHFKKECFEPGRIRHAQVLIKGSLPTERLSGWWSEEVPQPKTREAPVDVPLHMVCEEDDLSPAQVAAFEKAQKRYEMCQAMCAEVRQNRGMVSSFVQPDGGDLSVVSSDNTKTEEADVSEKPRQTMASSVLQNLADKIHQKSVIGSPQPGMAVPQVGGAISLGSVQPQLNFPVGISTLSALPQVRSSVILPTSGVQPNWQIPTISTMAPVSTASPLILAQQHTSSLPSVPQLMAGEKIFIPPKLMEKPSMKMETPNWKLKKSVSPARANLKPRPILPIGPVSRAGGSSPKSPKHLFESLSSISPIQSQSKASQPQFQGDGCRLIPLDEYYYCKQEGDPMYRESKGKSPFKCLHCHKIFYNNIKLMTHMQEHIDAEKQLYQDMQYLTRCKHCFEQFATIALMKEHVELVHQHNSSVLTCHICEKHMDKMSSLMLHMKTYHVANEMPYVCQLCSFRSSIYSDVVDHFKRRHDSARGLLCLYCLAVYKHNRNESIFYRHLIMHQVKSKRKPIKCRRCKLTFTTRALVDGHVKKDHLSNVRAISTVKGRRFKKTVKKNLKRVMTKVEDPFDVLEPSAKVVPKVANVGILSHTWASDSLGEVICLECIKSAKTPGHYSNHFRCGLCRYETNCKQSYANHLRAYHEDDKRLQRKVTFPEKRLPTPLYCICGFSSSYGNRVANHLLTCGKRTAHFKMPDVKFIEYDAEEFYQLKFKKMPKKCVDSFATSNRPYHKNQWRSSIRSENYDHVLNGNGKVLYTHPWTGHRGTVTDTLDEQWIPTYEPNKFHSGITGTEHLLNIKVEPGTVYYEHSHTTEDSLSLKEQPVSFPNINGTNQVLFPEMKPEFFHQSAADTNENVSGPEWDGNQADHERLGKSESSPFLQIIQESVRTTLPEPDVETELTAISDKADQAADVAKLDN